MKEKSGAFDIVFSNHIGNMRYTYSALLSYDIYLHVFISNAVYVMQNPMCRVHLVATHE